MRSRASDPPQFITPSVPQFLDDREAAQGCRSNRRLDPHEQAVVGDDDTRPLPLLSLSYPGTVFVGIVVSALGLVALFGHLFGWWTLFP